MDSLFTSLFHFSQALASLAFGSGGGGRRRGEMASSLTIRESFKGKYSTCKTSAGIEFSKRNPFNFFLRSPSIFKRNPIEKIRLQFYMEIPLLFSKNHKLETIFEKSHRSSVILKIVGATPQLVQNLTPIRNLLCTFLYLCCCYP